MAYKKIVVPANGKKITLTDGKLNVPDNPIVAFIEGDGTGPDIWAASQPVIDAAVEKAYGGQREIVWMEVYAGDKANDVYNETVWLPQETLDAIDEYLVAIKGPLTTPVGGGIRSINVALRQRLDLYACVRPVRYFNGVPSPVKQPELVDMVIFRENTEDIYAGVEWEAYSPEAVKVVDFLVNQMGVEQIRFPDSSGIGIKPVSEEGTGRLVRAAIQYAIDTKRDSVTLVHKGNIMKFTEGAFRNWGYKVAAEEFGATPLDGGPWHVLPNGLIVKDVIADAMLQQILHAAGGVFGVGDAEFERRLHQRCAGSAGGRHRYRAGRKYQLRDGSRHFRSHPRHGSQVCGAGQGQSVVCHTEWRDDAKAHGLGGSGGSDRELDGEDHWRGCRHIRFRQADG